MSNIDFMLVLEFEEKLIVGKLGIKIGRRFPDKNTSSFTFNFELGLQTQI